MLCLLEFARRSKIKGGWGEKERDKCIDLRNEG
jgi:hypothetical protein